VKWTGFIVIPSNGTYGFELNSDDGSWLYIDTQLIINRGGTQSPGSPSTGIATLTVGLHRIEIDYYETCSTSPGNSAGIDFYWQPPSAAGFTIVPSTVLTPSWVSGDSMIYDADNSNTYTPQFLATLTVSDGVETGTASVEITISR